jgi:signal transduction histidine kinase
MTRAGPPASYGDRVSGDPQGPPATVLPPPRRPRLPPRFWVVLDWVAAFLCALITYGLVLRSQVMYHFPYTGWEIEIWLRPLLAFGLSFPVAIRRRDPLLALALVLAACAVTMAFGGVLSNGPFLPLGLVLYLVAARCSRTIAITGLAVSLWLLAAQALVMHWTSPGGPGDAIAAALALIIVWMTGVVVQQRRAYATRLREQVASTAVTEERLRIARELHDVVAHHMTVVAVQAGFGEYVFERDPGEARAALGAIQRVTREALADMQRLLGVLRQGEASGPDAGRLEAARDEPLQLVPAPGLADLDRLVATTAGAGVRVEVAGHGNRPGIPAAIDQSAFRIVQEALTNVVKHSGADSCQVTVGCHGSDLCVEITDPGGPGRLIPANGTGHADGAGHGIIGMRERVNLCGGEFSAGPLPGQGFRVAARFPLNGAGR